MTPEQERALLDATAKGLDDDLRDAYRRMLDLMRSGTAPRDAVEQVMQSFAGEMADTLAAAFSAILSESVGSASVMAMEVGPITLSNRVYAESQRLSGVVQGVVDRHAKGFQDARKLTLDIFEGYGFREDEVIKLKPNSPQLPQYMRSELLRDPGLAGELQRYFARLQAEKVKTKSLQAAYLELLDAMERNAGWQVLEKKLDVAFYERMRYFANRIAQTELHRAFAERQAHELMDDVDVEYVQWRMSPAHPETDICDYFAGVDRYGLGRGVYPKRLAPVAPAHPHCRCVLSPRLDLTGRKASPKDGADMRFFRSMDEQQAAKVAGSKAKLAQVMTGADPLAVHNATIDPQYRVKTVQQTVTAQAQALV